MHARAPMNACACARACLRVCIQSKHRKSQPKPSSTFGLNEIIAQDTRVHEGGVIVGW